MPKTSPWRKAWAYRTSAQALFEHEAPTLARKLYFEQGLSHRLLTPEEERKLGRKALKGDKEAQHELVVHNLKLVVPIARHYVYTGVPPLDLLQEGNIGLMEAAKRFDPRKGFRFSTYATWWVRHHISRAVVDRLRREVRIPLHTEQALNELHDAREYLLKKGVEPTVPALAERMEKEPDKVRQLISFETRFESLSGSAYGEDYESGYAGKKVEDMLPSREASPEEELLAERTKWRVRRLIPMLPRDHEAVIRARYLIPYRRSVEGTLEHAVNLLIHENETGKPTHREIGERIGPFLSGGRQLVRERIRQIEEEALEKMRKKAA